MKLAIYEVAPITADTRQIVADIHERSATMAYGHIFSEPFPREETRQRWDSYAGRLALACSDERPVGFVAWQGAELDALYVLPEVAGRGLGSQLLTLSVGTSRLWVLEDNHQAQKFYQRHEWCPSGHVRQLSEGVRELQYIRRRAT